MSDDLDLDPETLLSPEDEAKMRAVVAAWSTRREELSPSDRRNIELAEKLLGIIDQRRRNDRRPGGAAMRRQIEAEIHDTWARLRKMLSGGD